MQLKGIDISTWQGGNVDFNKLKKDGVEFVIIRAGFGREISQKDNQFENNYKKAKAAGMPVGAYWYSYANSANDAITEAKTCLEVLKGKQFEYPIYFDIEDASMTGLGKNVLTQIVLNFCDTVEKAGYFVGVYSNPNWLKNYLNKSKLDKYTLWLAHWGVNEPGYACDLWQYSSNGSVSGISGRVDMNWGYRDFPTEIKKAGLNGFSVTEDTKPEEKPSEPAKDQSNGLKVGDKVKVNKGAKSYDGQSIASFVYDNTYTIDELVGDRAVLDLKGLCTAFKTTDLTKAGSTSSSGTSKPSTPSTSSGFKKGDKVKVKNPVVYGTNNKFTLYYDTYDVIEVSGDRVVIGIGSTVTSAIAASNLTKVSGSTSSSSTTLKEGDRVKLKSGAKWYDGTGIPSWVFNEKLYVRSGIYNDNTVLVSTLASGAITGRAKVSDLNKV